MRRSRRGMGADDGPVLDQLDRAISLNPRSAHLYASRGTVKAPHDNSGVLADFSRAIDLDPGVARFYCYRAFAFCDASDYAWALDDAERAMALELGPDDGIVPDRAAAIRGPCLGTRDGGGTH